MVTLSDAGWSPPEIARHLGCHPQTVRDALRSFLGRGTDALYPFRVMEHVGRWKGGNRERSSRCRQPRFPVSKHLKAAPHSISPTIYAYTEMHNGRTSSPGVA